LEGFLFELLLEDMKILQVLESEVDILPIAEARGFTLNLVS